MYLTGSPESTCTYYFNSKVETIYIPPVTRVGDTFVTVRRNTSGRSFGLVVRRKVQIQFGIVGVANHLIEGDVFECWSKRQEDFDYGNIYWHPLEFQIFATVLANYPIRDCDQQNLNRRLNRILLAHLNLTEFSAEIAKWTLEKHEQLVPHWRSEVTE
jgi:hypothetical protein